MAAEHTPGPWAQWERPDEGTLITDADGNRGVARAILRIENLQPSPGEMKANANLIAAAPELLEACEAVVARLDYLQNLWVKEGVTNSLCEQVRAAVKLAKGERP